MRVITLDRNNALVLRYVHNRRTPIMEHKLFERMEEAYGYAEGTITAALSHLISLELVKETDTGLVSANVRNIRGNSDDERYTVEAD